MAAKTIELEMYKYLAQLSEEGKKTVNERISIAQYNRNLKKPKGK